MSTSELVQLLTALQNEHGDLPVCVWDEQLGDCAVSQVKFQPKAFRFNDSQFGPVIMLWCM